VDASEWMNERRLLCSPPLAIWRFCFVLFFLYVFFYLIFAFTYPPPPIYLCGTCNRSNSIQQTENDVYKAHLSCHNAYNFSAFLSLYCTGLIRMIRSMDGIHMRERDYVKYPPGSGQAQRILDSLSEIWNVLLSRRPSIADFVMACQEKGGVDVKRRCWMLCSTAWKGVDR
jgi:hypothetical protein